MPRLGNSCNTVLIFTNSRWFDHFSLCAMLIEDTQVTIMMIEHKVLRSNRSELRREHGKTDVVFRSHRELQVGMTVRTHVDVEGAISADQQGEGEIGKSDTGVDHVARR